MNEELQNAATEYVLGTLPADERARFEEQLESDAELRAFVRDWQEKLAPLNATAPEVTPGAHVWDAIEGVVSRTTHPAATALADNIVRLQRRVTFWRYTTAAATALAAALALFAVIDRKSLPPEPAGGRYVAVVDTEGREPALIAEVDTSTGLITIRRLHAEAPAGHSLELWHVAEGHPPRSLGILKAGLNAQTIQGAATAEPVGGAIAVSVEPEGGSPSGKPTGPVIYSGKLIPVE